ncbi:hypothetical protein [Macrococcus sp. DPC7161]|uniref:hypothetical protein n=1 Tax=Macrococcus sp. DPC7161 TaxID=2507060 RepID=UPI00100B2121|nr:hypothetical protein [Macrococcus sp. DPC7161]RXK18706.1 hypothetical protein ER639_05400 [Macrococcus sp. DPC7161]
MIKINYSDLHTKYKKFKPLPNDKGTIERILVDKYKAFEIPLYSIDKEDYQNDDEVNEKDIYKLFHINDQQILSKIVDSYAIDDEGYTLDMEEKFDYDSLIAKHNAGKGISIVLESNDNQKVTNFKVYGPSNKLVRHLLCFVPPEHIVTDIDDFS